MASMKIEKAKRLSSYECGMASEYLVLSIMYRLGIDAYITLGNKKSVDIIIKAKNGNAITVDVKSVRAYSSIPINNVMVAANHYIIAVIYNNKFTETEYLPDIYIIPSTKIEALRTSFGAQHRLMKTAVAKFRNEWNQLTST